MFGSSPRYGTEVYDHEHSRDQLSIVFGSLGDVVAAWPVSRDAARTWELEVERFSSQYNLSQQIDQHRGGQTGGMPLSQDTYFLTAFSEFSERTRILALDGDRLALDDRSLAQWLINAEQNVVLGTDDHPLFETSLDDTACVITRLPNGLVAMTEVPRAHVLAARERIRSLLGDRNGFSAEVCIESPVRSTARYFLAAVKEGELVQRAGKEAEVTAFVVIGNGGFRFGLWSPSAGLFSEYGFIAPKEVIQLSDRAAPSKATTDILEKYVRHAFGQLELQLSKEKLEQLQLSGYTQVVWASEPGLSNSIAPIAAEHASQTGIQVFHLDAPLDEAVVGGMLLGSFAFGDTKAFGASILPQANLARDLLVLADTEQDRRRVTEQSLAKKRRDAAVFSLLAAPVAVIAVLLATVLGLILSQVYIGVREVQANKKTEELKPALDRRNSYEANLKWYQEFIKQVSKLRNQQPAGIGLLYQLNSDYPFTVDNSFYISDMKLLPTGAVEMKGYARSKDAVASFLKSLEFAGGPESGTRLFGNLAYEVQEGAPQPVVTAGQTAAPTMPGGIISANQIRPGVIVWSIKGTYLPVEAFAPPPPVKPGTPGTPAKPGAAATPAAQPQAQKQGGQ